MSIYKSTENLRHSCFEQAALGFVTGLASVCLVALPSVGKAAGVNEAPRQESTTQLELALSREWLRALHYESRGDGYVSRIDDERFFLTPNGRESPSEELAAFLAGVREHKKYRGALYKCIMPFRYDIVLRHGLVKADTSACPEFEFFTKDLGHDGASVVFVAQYADNPSSIMGHIFLRIANDTRKVNGESLPYLYKTLNYAAAIPPKTNIFKYVIQGIFGGFKGRFSLYEYAEAVEKYNNMEARDVFVYRLNLTSAEAEKLNAHAWELRELSSQDYFFFDENCAFEVLAILEAVRPDADLVSHLPFYTSPLDVLKIVNAAGMVNGVDYTASLYQRILDRMKAMTSAERAQFDDVLGGSGSVEEIQSPLVAETVIEAINLRKHEQHGKDNPKDEAIRQAVLLRRSTLAIGEPSYIHTVKIAPHLGHGAARIAVGGGTVDGTGFAQVRFRPAVHDLLSRHDGFQRNSSLSLLAIEIRKYVKEDPEIESLELINLAKLNGTRVQTRMAWLIDLTLRTRDRSCIACLSPDFSVGIGRSQDLWIDTLDFFVLGRAAYRPYVQNRTWGPGVGATAGISFTPAAKFRLLMMGSRAVNIDMIALDDWAFSGAYDLSEVWDARASWHYLKLRGEAGEVELNLNLGFSF